MVYSCQTYTLPFNIFWLCVLFVSFAAWPQSNKITEWLKLEGTSGGQMCASILYFSVTNRYKFNSKKKNPALPLLYKIQNHHCSQQIGLKLCRRIKYVYSVSGCSRLSDTELLKMEKSSIAVKYSALALSNSKWWQIQYSNCEFPRVNQILFYRNIYICRHYFFLIYNIWLKSSLCTIC